MLALRWAFCPLLLTLVDALPFDEEIYVPHLEGTLVVSRIPRRKPVTPPSELHVVDSVLPLRRAGGHSLSSVYVDAFRAAAMGQTPNKRNVFERQTPGIVPFTSIGGSIFTVPLTIGGEAFDLVVDTGSSDPWVASNTFTCVDVPTKTSQDQADCSFGPLFDKTRSTTYTQVPDENFNVSYADGENLNGNMGFETFQIGGITVTQQKFGLVERAAWYGDSISSGLVGFAYSTLTSAYAGSDPSRDVKGRQIPYATLFTNIYRRNLAAPIFSIAMSRDPNNSGLMAIGGIPDVQHSPYFATVPIQPVGINGTTGEYVYQFYSVVIDGWAWSASQDAQFNVAGTNNPRKTNLVAGGTQVIIDSGTSLVYAPNNVAAGIANSFDPPAEYNSYEGAYSVDCDATAPVIGVSIGKKIFYINPVDMFIPGPYQGRCYLGVQPNMGGLTILGDVWLKSVLAVFDIGAEQMRFAAREFYATPPCDGQRCPNLIT